MRPATAGPLTNPVIGPLGQRALGFLLALLALLGGCNQMARMQRAGKPCIDCHAADRARVTGLDHLQPGFPEDCTQCHPSQTEWTPARFDHAPFPLDGAHAKVPCGSCHDRTPLPRDCVGCHDEDRRRPGDPDHLAPGFSTDCKACHSTVSWKGAGGSGCTLCHGSTENAAPPRSVGGESATSARGVGAHQAHLKISGWHAPFACGACHQVPSQTDAPGHRDTPLPAEVLLKGLARSGGAQPSWDGTSCSGVYCHGATRSGGTVPSPQWTVVDGSAAACGACHGLPPGGDHPAAGDCSTCHGAVVDASRKIIAPQLHINGTVESMGAHPAGWGVGSIHGPAFFQDKSGCQSCHGADLEGGSAKACTTCHQPGWKTNCTTCHGGKDSATGAPPFSVQGDSSTGVAGVGRHTAHLAPGATHGAYACSLCHQVPTDALSAGHIDPAPAEVVFQGLASGSSYSFSTAQCSNVYCHGNGRGSGGSAPWTGSLAGGCAACHGATPSSGEHPKHREKNLGCQDCHACVAGSSLQIVNASLHVDGKPDVCGNGVGWNAASRSCSPSCHEGKSW